MVDDGEELRNAEEETEYNEQADEFAAVLAEEKTESGGDILVEQLSAEHHAEVIANITKLPEKAASYIVSAIYVTVGVLCIALTSVITEILPYIVGGMLILAGIVRFIFALIQKEYRSLNTNATATSLIATLLGIMIIVQKIDPDSDPVMMIAVVWGVLGLFESAHAFNHVFKRIANSERCIFYLIRGIVECAVAFMLLYQPENHDVHFFHIVVLGVNLIVDGITMLPFLKKVLTVK